MSVTSLLLISSLISLMSMSLEGVGTPVLNRTCMLLIGFQVMSHAREEYIFQSVTKSALV